MRRSFSLEHSFFVGLAVLAALVRAVPYAAQANATINVPADQPTIQAAINAASDNTTVMVAQGTYYENINFLGKAILVASSGGPSVTTINGNAAGPVVTFNTSEGSGSMLYGFTITNGSGGACGSISGAGGICINSASPAITGNVITGNAAGGINAYNSSASIQNNVISNNQAPSGYDGGVSIAGSGFVQLIGNWISSNSAGGGGRGVCGHAIAARNPDD